MSYPLFSDDGPKLCDVCMVPDCNHVETLGTTVSPWEMTSMPKTDEQPDYVIAEERVIDEQAERVLYGIGDRIPYDEAVKLGLVTAKKAEAPKAEGTPQAAKRTTTKRKTETRSTK